MEHNTKKNHLTFDNFFFGRLYRLYPLSILTIPSRLISPVCVCVCVIDVCLFVCHNSVFGCCCRKAYLFFGRRRKRRIKTIYRQKWNSFTFLLLHCICLVCLCLVCSFSFSLVVVVEFHWNSFNSFFFYGLAQWYCSRARCPNW